MRALILNFTVLFALAVAAVEEDCSINEKACAIKGSVMLQAKLAEQNASGILEEVHPKENTDSAAAQAQNEGQAAEGPDAIAQFAAFQQGKETNTGEDCADDFSFTDEKGRKCSSWDGYPCEEATEKWSYTKEGQAELLSKCKSTCGTCKGQCSDVPDFTDAKGHACTKWRGYNCVDAAELWSYSNEDEDSLIKNCAKSCKKCEWFQEEEHQQKRTKIEEEEEQEDKTRIEVEEHSQEEEEKDEKKEEKKEEEDEEEEEKEEEEESNREESEREEEEAEEENEQRAEDDEAHKVNNVDSQYGDDSQYSGDSM